ncbi:hypothetical protein BC827DRAFT_1221294 [Russula dissimulans]|nr:hypothetical protein BC827DRAFT_1221294 [Russula dissimulans]
MLRSIRSGLPDRKDLDDRKSLPSPVTRLRVRSFHSRRLRNPFYLLLFLALLVLLYLLLYASPRAHSDEDILFYLRGLPKPERGPNPPLFYEWHDREKRLPQHNPDLPYPQGRQGRYLRFASQGNSAGFGNIMQEIFFNAHLASLSKRIYTFENYTLDVNPNVEYTNFEGEKVAARVPLTAVVGGPMAGDPFPSSANTPPAVIPEFFKQVCPNPIIVDREEVSGPLPDASAATIFQIWLDKLEQIEDRCVEIRTNTWPVFDLWLFGDSTRLLDIWSSLSASPIMTHFTWSPLIIAAILANAQVIHPSLSYATATSFMPSSKPAPLTGLLTMHLLRADFAEHCTRLSKWSSTFMGWNEFPGFPDNFPRPAVKNQGQASPEDVARYTARCYPDIKQIVSRVREVRTALLPTKLTRMYLMTNGNAKWIRELKEALQEDGRRAGLGEWSHIGTSRDLRLTREQRHLSHSVDMAIAQRAEVFIGNGFSSTTSNAVMLRAAQGYPWDTTRFW